MFEKGKENPYVIDFVNIYKWEVFKVVLDGKILLDKVQDHRRYTLTEVIIVGTWHCGSGASHGI